MSRILSHFLFLITTCTALHYTAPEDCQWSPAGQDVSLICRVDAISSNGRSTNFTLIQSEHTVSLRIMCDDVLFESHLQNGSLSHLKHLKSLHIEYCKLSVLPNGVFHGLNDLRHLTIRTHNKEWGSISLRLAQRVLHQMKHLEYIDLSFNNIIDLPSHVFCELNALKLLNMSQNSLIDANRLDFFINPDNQCLPELLQLDLSGNNFKNLDGGSFSSLKNLQELDLRNNMITQLTDSALEGLGKLQLLYLSNNYIKIIPTQLFKHTPDLREIHLQNNSISTLSVGLFSGLQQLLVLNLSRNDITSLGITSEVLSDLIRLVVLDLSHNHLRHVDFTTFQSQHSLQILYLSYNEIETIADNAFSSLYNLHTLILTGNHLRNLDVFTLNGLYVLSYLGLNDNKLEHIHPDAFRNCSSVQDLMLGGNKFSTFPSSIWSLQFLRTLYLSGNNIKEVTNNTFRGMKHLLNLYLSRNEVGNLSRGTFRDVPALKYLDISYNKIQALEHGVFDDAPDLHTIILNDNYLMDINGLFMNLHFLQHLNVSRNRITWFDYALIPTELEILDLHHNEIETLGNYFELESVLHLLILDASFNFIREINAATFPNKIEKIRLNNNRIKIINPFTFMAKSNLSSVNLTNNYLQSLDINAFRLKPITPSKHLPEFLISGNPFFCDCTMEWMQRINNLDETRQYPKIADLHEVVCQLPFSRRAPSVLLSDVNSSDFLCKYRSHCFALCHCCDFDACDCEMVCPENCTCYSDQTWNTNIVDCSGRGHSSIPGRVPMDATELYLDGNEMPHLSSHSFIGRKNMKVLYLNNSNIQEINQRTFNGLQALQILHLENNKIKELQGYEFENLTHLRELYLSNNQLKHISNFTFLTLKSLEILHMDHNHMVEFQVWNFNYNRRLSNVRLSHNIWSCRCEYLENFQDWLQSFGVYVKDSENIRCYQNQTGGLFILEFNASSCSNYTAITYYQTVFSRNYMPIMIVVPTLFILVLLLLILACVYRREMKIWIYSRYGVRLFQRNHYSPDSEKLFDAFVSYCKKDEAFVAQILAPELECGHQPYRLCLRYRDLPMVGYVADAISEAIECSHRTIAVVSEQFLKNEWGRFELKTAYHESQCNDRRHRLVVVLLDKISFKELDPDARLCLRSSIVVHWGDKRFWEKLRYAIPDNGRRNSTESRLPCSLTMSAQSNSVKLV